MASGMVKYLVSRGVEGADVLEVGGGVGGIQLELLKAGVAKTVNIELSSGYEEAAQELAEQEAFEDRITRRLGDFVEHQHEFEPADVVVMNRVVCCYPWMERMMEAAANKTGRFLALTFPREKWWMKFGVGFVNRLMGLRKCDFRAFVHPGADIESVATRAGLVVPLHEQQPCLAGARTRTGDLGEPRWALDRVGRPRRRTRSARQYPGWS